MKQQRTDQSVFNIKVPLERFERCFDVIKRSYCVVLLQVEPRKGLWSNTLLSTSLQLLSLSLSPPRPPLKISLHLDQWFSKCGTQRNLRIKYKSGRMSTKAIFFNCFKWERLFHAEHSGVFFLGTENLRMLALISVTF